MGLCETRKLGTCMHLNGVLDTTLKVHLESYVVVHVFGGLVNAFHRASLR